MRRTTSLFVLAGALAAGALGYAVLTPSAHAQPSGSGPAPFATVDVVELIQSMLQMEEYSGPRDALFEEIDLQLQQMQTRLIQLQGQIQSLTPEDPTRNALIGEFQQVQMEAQQLSQSGGARHEQMGAAQAAEIYARIYDAARTVAAREGHRYVLASRTPVRDLDQVDSLANVIQNVLARPVMLGAEPNDLTPLVRAELGLPEQDAPVADPSGTDPVGASPVDDSAPAQQDGQPSDE